MSTKKLRSALREMSLPQLYRVHHQLSQMQRTAKPFRRHLLNVRLSIVERYIERAELLTQCA